MKDAILVNPYDMEATAEAIYRALNMSKRERVRRWRSLITDVQTQTAEAWSEAFLDDLDEICESRDAERAAADS
jgi:trehalose 6-phosphate synthase